MARQDDGGPGTSSTPAPTSTSPRHRRRDEPRTPTRSGQLWRFAPVVLAILAIAYGAVLRLWLLVHLPLFGDEAVVGLMARQIDAGHFTAFYWGQFYGGVEPYPAALALRLGGTARWPST